MHLEGGAGFDSRGAHLEVVVARYGSIDRERDSRGARFVTSIRCDGCGRPVGVEYGTDDEVCGSSDGPGFYLCRRETCSATAHARTTDVTSVLVPAWANRDYLIAALFSLGVRPVASGVGLRLVTHGRQRAVRAYACPPGQPARVLVEVRLPAAVAVSVGDLEAIARELGVVYRPSLVAGTVPLTRNQRRELRAAALRRTP